ncbi:MAG: hypothetical protein U1E27_11575, partial [Kiritimatiellia bacterium]|nr:hypothetical protein [Kiritimatiellia bacterium]
MKSDRAPRTRGMATYFSGRLAPIVFVLLASVAAAYSQTAWSIDDGIPNSGFESKNAQGSPTDWSWYHRDSGLYPEHGSVICETGVSRSGTNAARVVYVADRDWALTCLPRHNVQDGDALIFRAWTRGDSEFLGNQALKMALVPFKNGQQWTNQSGILIWDWKSVTPAM